jgi:hypothetical protein
MPCNIVINDFDRHVMLRNLLLFLTFSSLPPAEAAETGLHLWYSAKLPAPVLERLRGVLAIQLRKIQLQMEKTPSAPQATLLSSTFSLGDKAAMHCVLPRAYWTELLNMLNFKLESREASRRRRLITAGDGRRDYRERNLYLLPPGRRVPKQQYFDDGLLLPFGDDRRPFTEANLQVPPHPSLVRSC